MVEKMPANAGDIRDAGLISVLGRSPGGGNDNPLQYSCLETSMDRGAWRSTVHGVAKGQTRLSTLAWLYFPTVFASLWGRGCVSVSTVCF